MGRRIKLGDVYSIKLPNDKYAFVRVYQDGTIGVYKKRGSTADDVPTTDEFEFFVSVYRYAYKNWHYVTNRPFDNEEESWGPPFCWVDSFGKGSIYYKGEQRSCTYEECKDLEICAVWEEEHLIDRLMGNPKWQNMLSKPIPPL